MHKTEHYQTAHHPLAKKPLRWWNILVLVGGLVVLIVVAGSSLVAMEYKNKAISRVYYRERMDPQATEHGLTPADIILPPEAHPRKVSAGVYIDRIVELSMKDLTWVVDCYLWFRWQDSSLHMSDNFQVVDGWIDSREKKDEYIDGNEHYVLYRIIAHITSVFEELRFPCDDHLLTVCIEYPSYERSGMLFEADTINSAVSSRVKVPGYKIYQMAVVEKPHSYKTSRGDPRMHPGVKATFSQFRMGLWIKRESWGFFLKMFLPLYVSVLVAMLAFFINPLHSDPRFGLGIGALFAAVANSYINSSMLPNTGVMSLADVINIAGISTILLTLIESAISLYIYEKRGKHSLSQRFDRVSFYIMLGGYVVLNIALPLAAAY